MATQLEQYLAANGGNLDVKGKKFAVSDFVRDEDIVLATFKGVRASYTGMLLPKCRVAGKPNAEAWEVMGSRGNKIVAFAVDGDKLFALA